MPLPLLLALEYDLPFPGGTLLLVGGAAAAGLVLLLLLALVFLRGKKPAPAVSPLSEDLSTYPAPPPGAARVRVMNVPARVRLVVVAPVGKQPLGEPEEVLDGLLRGLARVLRADKPRVRTWPSQLSNKGFPPTFFRETRRPEREGKPSRWVLVAGQGRSGGRPVLVGLALYTEEPTELGRITVEDADWGGVLQLDR